MMTDSPQWREAIRLSVGSTLSYMDNVRNVTLIRGAKTAEERELIVGAILAARKEWRVWQTMVQRRWQKETRNPNKARHHDSISVRERYVRIGN